MTIWDVLDEESWNKGVGVGTYTGDITVTSPDTVEVALKGSKSPYLTGTYDFILFRFKLQAVAYEIEELRVNINDETVADGGKWTLEGSASVELAISGKYQGTENLSAFPERIMRSRAMTGWRFLSTTAVRMLNLPSPEKAI